MGVSLAKYDIEVVVKTGDVKGGGTDSNVYCKIIDEHDVESHDINLDCKWRNDFEKGSVDRFPLRNMPTFGEIKKIILWRDKSGLNDDWYVEYVMIQEYKRKGILHPFPINRWIQDGIKYEILKYDSILPQFDDRKMQRKHELDLKKNRYRFQENITGLPRQIAEVPPEEKFSNDYKWKIVESIIDLQVTQGIDKILEKLNAYWNSFDDMFDVYDQTLGVPYGFYEWRSDERFGQQRLRGCNPTMLFLCKEIPEKFAVTEGMIIPFLEGLSMEEAIQNKKLYMTDLADIQGIACLDEDQVMCAPMALFYCNNFGKLVPIAIQLFQEPGPDNPVFLPNIYANKWLLAKMFYNNAEAAIHQSCTHLGFTHLACETICVSMHLTLSPSHPVYRLMMPHFIYLLQINKLGVSELLSKGAIIDQIMTLGAEGTKEIVRRRWKNWRMDTHGWLPGDLKRRGVDDLKALPKYYYRDDALLLHETIYNYVTEVIKNIYVNQGDLTDDNEIQEFAQLLVDEVNGPGVKGVFGGGKFDDVEDLIKTLTTTIFIATASHGAVNFCQYDEYGYPPFYPGKLLGNPPTNMEDIEEDEILSHFPDKTTTSKIMTTTHLLSTQALNPLGDFEVQYQFDPKSLKAVENFQAALKSVSSKIKLRNAGRRHPYPYLDPQNLPNAISI